MMLNNPQEKRGGYKKYETRKKKRTLWSLSYLTSLLRNIAHPPRVNAAI